MSIASRIDKLGFDKQFLFFIVQNVCIGIFDKIDNSFGNHIDIDSICVLSSFVVITWMTYSIYNIGGYAFRMTMKNVKLNLFIQLFTGIIVGVTVFLLHNQIPYIYNLTNTQNDMFKQCLIVHAISCPILAVREYLGNYCEYMCLNKQAATGNIIMYVTMIITDAYVILFGSKTLVELIAWTGVCSLIYCIYMLYATKILKETFKFKLEDLKYSLKHGSNVIIDRISGKVATIFFNAYASKMSTLEYSIHAVCYSAGTFSENFTNALYTYCVVDSAKYKGKLKEQFQSCIEATKKNWYRLAIGGYITNYIVILFLHGKAPFTNSLVWLSLYSFQIFALFLYEPTRAFLTSSGNSKYLRFGGMIGILIRIPLVYIGYNLGMRLFIFSIATTFDFLSRGIYFYIASKKVINNDKKSKHTI